MAIPQAFIYDNEVYFKVTPGKRLFQSTMIHDVVNRGDVFAVRMKDQLLTIIPGTAKITPIKLPSIDVDADSNDIYITAHGLTIAVDDE